MNRVGVWLVVCTQHPLFQRCKCKPQPTSEGTPGKHGESDHDASSHHGRALAPMRDAAQESILQYN
eukprot:859641-Amphidinium_carterae.1